MLDTSSMEFGADLTRLGGANVDDALTVERGNHPGWSLERKVCRGRCMIACDQGGSQVKHALKSRVHALLLDEQVHRLGVWRDVYNCGIDSVGVAEHCARESLRWCVWCVRRA
jgi:hypothetical protein